MTNKQKLIRRLITENNGKIYISQHKAMKLLGRGRESFQRMMAGYNYRKCGRNHAREYLVDDVAEAELKGGTT